MGSGESTLHPRAKQIGVSSVVAQTGQSNFRAALEKESVFSQSPCCNSHVAIEEKPLSPQESERLLQKKPNAETCFWTCRLVPTERNTDADDFSRRSTAASESEDVDWHCMTKDAALGVHFEASAKEETSAPTDDAKVSEDSNESAARVMEVEVSEPSMEVVVPEVGCYVEVESEVEAEAKSEALANDAMHAGIVMPSQLSNGTTQSHLDRWSETDESVVILDWDDTLCPTSSLELNHDLTNEALATHVDVVIELLRLAATVGHVFIVTMAAEGWVESCIKRWMPGIQAIFEELGITTVSARSVSKNSVRMARQECRDMGQFLKTQVMKRVIKDFYSYKPSHQIGKGSDRKSRSWKNILSVGDSQAERRALQDVVFRHVQRDCRGQWEECLCKTVLLMERPDHEKLTAELRVVTQWLPALMANDGDLDLQFDGGDLRAADESVELLACLQFDGAGARAADESV